MGLTLTNTPYGNAQAVVELAILDENIRRVCFRGNTVISVVHSPSAKGDVARVNGIRSISIGCLGLVGSVDHHYNCRIEG